MIFIDHKVKRSSHVHLCLWWALSRNAHMAATELVELVESLESLASGSQVSKAIQDSVTYLRTKCDNQRVRSCHGALCGAMLTGVQIAPGMPNSEAASELLNVCGPGQALRVVFASIAQAEMPAAVWLAQEVQSLLSSGGLVALLTSEFHPPPLTFEQEQLVNIICRLPDCLANRLGRQLPLSLLPPQYFKSVGQSIVECLIRSQTNREGASVAFVSAVVGKAVLLGHKESILSAVLRLLEEHVTHSPVWEHVSHDLFYHLPTAGLEGVLEYLVQNTSPSVCPSLLHSLLGDVALSNSKAKFILSHKLALVRVLPLSNAVYNLIGYLSSCDPVLLGNSLERALGVWSDASALRHMSDRQHLWISSLLVLGINCLKESKLPEFKAKLQRLTMAGIEAHIQSPLEHVRLMGMAVGEVLMNTLCPSGTDKQLQFEYQPTDEIRTLLKLSRPLAEIQKELEAMEEERVGDKNSGDGSGVCGGGGPSEGSAGCEGDERYGQGMVNTTEYSDTDSDDDLPPYDMTDDPDSSAPRPPQYLRTLIQGLLSSKDPLKTESSLKVAEKLIRSEPSDLSEVCVELAKILLHLSDVYALPDFVSLRLNSLVALSVTRPRLVATYLTGEFYGPHYTLRQRMDILEVISAAALELSQPRPSGDQSKGHGTMQPSRARKPWEEVIQERLKAKTRVISKGRSKFPPPAVPSRFADVAPLFFFPLMSSYDSPRDTLDLLGQDSLVLGNLLYTLGTVMYAANHAPLTPAMGSALLDFTWALRYHSAVYVRQGVLYSLAMLISTTPLQVLLTEMEGNLGEAIQWTVGVASEDADAQCRALAQHVLTLFQSTVKQFQDK